MMLGERSAECTVRYDDDRPHGTPLEDAQSDASSTVRPAQPLFPLPPSPSSPSQSLALKCQNPGPSDLSQSPQTPRESTTLLWAPAHPRPHSPKRPTCPL